jgi:hypothetical protein
MKVVAACMLVSLTTDAGGQTSGGTSSFGGELRGITQIRGEVVCVGCSLNEVRSAEPGERKLHQVSYPGGQLVMKITWTNEPQRWIALVSSPYLWVRAKASVLQQLTAEENLFQELEVTGLLRDTRTFDIHEVKVRRRRTPVGEE